jgi:hypothetical protein
MSAAKTRSLLGNRGLRRGSPTAAVLRCLWRGLPVALAANASCRRLAAAFEARVTPMIGTVATAAGQRGLHDQLLAWGIRNGYLIENYARLTGSASQPETAVLAGAFARLYDDVIDELDDASVGDRLAQLFAGDEFVARGSVQQLLVAVFGRLEELTPRAANPTAYRALMALHRRQLESLRQAGSTISTEELWQLTLAKGGLAMTVLGSLVHPNLESDEEALLYDMGALLQLVDDYQDAVDDDRRGLITPATRGDLSVRHLLASLHDIEARASTRYGARPARTFMDSLYLWLFSVVVARAVRRGPVQRGRARSVPRLFPMRVILARHDVMHGQDR